MQRDNLSVDVGELFTVLLGKGFRLRRRSDVKAKLDDSSLRGSLRYQDGKVTLDLSRSTLNRNDPPGSI
jgi:hypothetical protein